ncbi:PAS domain S-box protein [Halobacteriales archaeon Cl-PHB]
MVSAADRIEVLVVTADDDYAAALGTHLDGADVSLTTVGTVEAAVDHLAETAVDCVVSDHDLPDTDGLALLHAVRAQFPTLPFVLFTSEGSERVASQAIAADVTDYRIKDGDDPPWDDLQEVLRAAVTYDRSHPGPADERARARTVLDAVPDTVAVVQDDRLVFVNDAATDLLGVGSPDDLLDESVDAVVPAETATVSPADLAAIQAGDRTVSRVETRLATPDGATVPVEATAARIRWDGAPAVLLTCRDLTSQRARWQAHTEVAGALRNEGQLVDRIFEHSPIAKLILDTQGTILRANTRAEALLGLPKATITGRSFDAPEWKVVDADGEPVPGEVLPFARARATGEAVYGAEYGVELPDGERRWLSVNVAPVHDEAGEPRYYVAALEDVTAEKRLRDELERSEELHRVTLNNITDTVVLTDDEGAFTYVCPNVDFIFGYDAAEVRAMGTVETLLGTDPVPPDFADGDVVQNVELEVVDTDGATHTVLVTVRSVDVQDGTRLYSIRDVTERKDQERRFQTFVENISDVLVVLRDDGSIGYVTPSVTDWLDYDPADLTDTLAFDLVHPADRQRVYEAFERLQRGSDGTTARVDFRLQHADGSYRWTSTITAKRTELADGDYLVNSRDVTERVERERRLEELDESRSLALRAADAGIWSWDLETGAVTWHESCERLFGLEPGSFEGTFEAFADRVHPDELPALRETIDDAIAAHRPFSHLFRIRRDDGVERWIDARGKLVTDETGEPVELLGVDVDVTERQEHIQQLRVLDTVLRHNLRNDMNVIRGNAETILERVDEPVASYAQKIVDQSDHLIDLTEKEREITRVLSSGGSVERLDPADLLRSVVDRVAGAHPTATIETDLADDVTVVAKTELDRALTELVENAVVHSDRENPEIAVSLQATEDGATIAIADDGPGIPEVERQLLTGGHDIEPLYHGNGLGLWLVNWIVRRSGGAIEFVENDPRGTVVVISLSTDQ